MFKLNKFLFPFLFFLAASVAIFIAFPLEENSKEKIYRYSVQTDEFEKKISYAPLIAELALVIALCIWYASQSDLPEQSTHRTFLQVLYDKASADTESQFDVYAPFKKSHDDTFHDHPLGDWPQGALGLGVVPNVNSKPVYMIYVANSDYATCESRPRRDCPILASSFNPAHVEDAVRMLKPSLRANEEQMIERVFRRLKGAPSEKKEYLKGRVEKTLSEEDDENVS